MMEPPLTHSRSWLLVASIITLITITLFSGYFSIRGSALKRMFKAIVTEKTQLEAQARSTSTSIPQTETVLAGLKLELKKIETTQLLWSKVMELIERTIPKRNLTKDAVAQPLIDIRNYNVSEDGAISLSASTKFQSSDHYADVANVIKAFSAEPSFKSVFVPSILKTTTLDSSTDATSILSFALNFRYQKPSL